MGRPARTGRVAPGSNEYSPSDDDAHTRPRLSSKSEPTPPLAPGPGSEWPCTTPSLHRFRPLRVLIHTSPSEVASTDRTTSLSSPCPVDSLPTAMSRKRSRPPRVAQTFPSRSSKMSPRSCPTGRRRIDASGHHGRGGLRCPGSRSRSTTAVAQERGRPPPRDVSFAIFEDVDHGRARQAVDAPESMRPAIMDVEDSVVLGPDPESTTAVAQERGRPHLPETAEFGRTSDHRSWICNGSSVPSTRRASGMSQK